MFVIGSNSASTGYNLTRSLRTRASASAYLNRTPASAGNRQTWTWSAWVKRGTLTGDQAIFFAGTAGNNNTLRFNSDNTMYVFRYDGAITWGLSTTQVFRDPSAWYHIVVAYDSTQATSTNRVKLYINGTQVTAFSSATYPSLNLNSDVNNTVVHRISNNDASNNFDGYQTEDNLVDGQALTPSSFGSTNALTGVWQPARYTGTYGTNGFYLNFTDNSALTTASNVGLGKDFSGNGNYWTTNNISITAGVTYDSMTDVSTLTSATAANFAVLNPLDRGNLVTITNGNLSCAYNANNAFSRATMSMPSGKWYWEAVITGGTSPYSSSLGIAKSTDSGAAGNSATAYVYQYTGNKNNNSSSVAYGSSYTLGDVIGVAFDAAAGTLVFYKNNTSQGTAYSSLTSLDFFPIVGTNDGTWAINFGQRPFTYTAPTGFVALNTYNLPTSTIVKGNSVMDATTYSGTGAIQSIVNAGGFKPDLLWVKARSRSSSHDLVDSVRGVNLALTSNSTQAEITGSFITSLNSNGFTLPANTLSDAYFTNVSGDTLVGWQWQAGQGSTSSNTNGTITSTVSVNASAGFSVVTWTANGSANQTIGHGLGVTPSLVIVKHRNDTDNWAVWITGFSSSQFLRLNTTDSTATSAGFWNATPTSSVFSVGSTGTSINVSGGTYVAYCWTPIAGFSAFGSYTGNGSADGPFVYLGFRPKFVMIKRTDTSGFSWEISDSSRNPSNVVNLRLFADLSNADNTQDEYDYVSNGLKVRTTNTNTNASGGTYIYMAYAENPLKNALAR